MSWICGCGFQHWVKKDIRFALSKGQQYKPRVLRRPQNLRYKWLYSTPVYWGLHALLQQEVGSPISVSLLKTVLLFYGISKIWKHERYLNITLFLTKAFYPKIYLISLMLEVRTLTPIDPIESGECKFRGGGFSSFKLTYLKKTPILTCFWESFSSGTQ